MNRVMLSNLDYQRYLGKTGKALTLLRPAGSALIDGERVDVVTNGSFIQTQNKSHCSRRHTDYSSKEDSNKENCRVYTYIQKSKRRCSPLG